MKLLDLENRLTSWYAASVREGGPSFYTVSSPGRGKTSTLALTPQKLQARWPDKRFGIVIINGACLTETGSTGYLWPVEQDGVQYSRFTRPHWWMTTDGEPLEAYDGGVILIDEEDKLSVDLKKIVGEAALSKRFGTHVLPAGWVVWFAGNRDGDRSGSTRKLDHLIDRRIQIEVQDDLGSLLNFMDRNGCLAETKAFAEEHPNLVFQTQPKEQGPWMTPRGLVQTDTHLQSLMEVDESDTIPTDALTQEEVAGRVGSGAAAQLMATIKLGQELPPYADIIAKPDKVPVPKQPGALRLAAYKIAALVKTEEMSAALTYIKRITMPEFQLVFGRAAIQRDFRLVTNPDFKKWCGQNAELIRLLQRFK